LWRNNEFFDGWADPASLQTVVQPNGQFILAIQAGRADRDLFEAEPANYRVTITSVGVDEPVTASILFDTFGLPAPTEPPPATLTPRPTATAVARVTILPSATSTTAMLQTATPPKAVAPQSAPLGPIIIGIVLLGALIIIGFVVFWLITRKQN
jgi:hypothetical protein